MNLDFDFWLNYQVLKDQKVFHIKPLFKNTVRGSPPTRKERNTGMPNESKRDSITCLTRSCLSKWCRAGAGEHSLVHTSCRGDGAAGNPPK